MWKTLKEYIIIIIIIGYVVKETRRNDRLHNRQMQLDMTGWARWSTGNCVEVWPYEQMVYAQLRICSKEWDAQTLLGFWNSNVSPNLGQTTRSYNNQQPKKKKKKKKKEKEKRTCRVVDFAVSAVHRVKLKGSEKRINTSTLILFTNPSARGGYDTRSIFKQSSTGLNSEFSFS